jgi:Uma2 family endonuclease
MTVPGLLTADDLLRQQPSDKRTELVRGVMVVREPPGCQHGDIAVNLTVVLSHFVRTRNLGRVWSETGYVLSANPDTVRGPDVSFVRQERVPDPIPRGFARFAPDLAIEVLSPDDRPGEVLEKVADYLNAGTQLVWIVDPDRRQARVHRADGSVATIPEAGVLDGEELLPGFTCTLAEILG